MPFYPAGAGQEGLRKEAGGAAERSAGRGMAPSEATPGLRGWRPEFEPVIRREAGDWGALAGGLPRSGGGEGSRRPGPGVGEPAGARRESAAGGGTGGAAGGGVSPGSGGRHYRAQCLAG